jgi:menaquinone-dependent protoporphyrinogen IX oxidase
MKSAVIYYSKSGKTKAIADKIAAKFKSDIYGSSGVPVGKIRCRNAR